MGPLDRKLMRDLERLWAQSLAIAFVMAAGVATLILAVGAHESLQETRAAYYDQNRFADVFAQVTRAPNALASEIARIPGVAAVETRITKIALLDIEGMREPASGLLVSVPDVTEPVLNLITLQRGRTPGSAAEGEVVVNEAFAKAHGFDVGSSFLGLLNGRKRRLTIVGIALSPEYIYAVGPWDLMPDDRRFGILWMSEKALAAAYDLEGAFSTASLRLMREASEGEVIRRLDDLLARYGGRGAHGRKDQASHAFLDAELKQLKAMASVLPPIFLLVAGFLVNMTLSRLVALEREQIGLLKALGYGTRAVAFHYLKFVGVIALGGTAIGSLIGTWLGIELTQLYSDFFHFPFLIFRSTPEIYLLAAGVTVAAAMLGAAWAVFKVARLPPAVAMQAPSPPRYRRLFVERLGLVRLFSQAGTMVLRNFARSPGRALSSILGISLATAILASAFGMYDAVDEMIDVQFFQTERQDASIDFTTRRPRSAVAEVARLPGVLAAEPYRAIPARLRHGHVERRVGILGKPATADLSRVLDLRNAPIRLPETGVVLSEMLANILSVRAGDMVEVELLEDERRTIPVPVTAIVQGYLGLMAYMDLDAATRLVGEGPTVSGVHLSMDPARQDDLFAKLKGIPTASFIALQRVSLEKFRETLAQNILFMIGIYVSLAVTIAFGVVYNSARISLSERARELASLRVLGFTRAETSLILLSELAIIALLAQPFGWLIGYGISWIMAEGLASELYRIPVGISPKSDAIASLITLGAATVSALIVRRRVDRFDLVEVLKTRD